MKNTGKRLSLAGFLLAGITALSPVQAQDNKPIEDSGKTTTITVPSQRKGYEGIPFTYDVLDFYARRTDEPQTRFLPRFFYDIDNDGKFGPMEEAMQKAGIPVYMSDDFTQKFLDAYRKQDKEKMLKYFEQLKEVKKNSKSQKEGYEKQLTEYKTKLSKLEEELKLYQIQTAQSQTTIPKVPEEKTQTSETKKEKDYRSVYLLAQQTANGNFNSYITSIGARLNPFKNTDIGFGANLDIGFGLDNLVDSYNGQLSAGRTASGTLTDTNKLSIGGSLEAQLGPFVLGGGIDYKIWVRNVVEQILDSSGSVVKSNTNSTPDRQVFGKVYGGVEVPLGDNVKVGMIGGYNGKDGAYFGIRGCIKIK